MKFSYFPFILLPALVSACPFPRPQEEELPTYTKEEIDDIKREFRESTPKQPRGKEQLQSQDNFE